MLRKATQSFVIFGYSALLQNIMQSFKVKQNCFSLRLNTSREFSDPVGSIVSLLFIQILKKRCLHGHGATIKNHINAKGPKDAHKLKQHDNFRSHEILLQIFFTLVILIVRRQNWMQLWRSEIPTSHNLLPSRIFLVTSAVLSVPGALGPYER